MENDRLKLKFSYADEISGKRPTDRQLAVLFALNPFLKKTTYNDAAETLGISRAAVQHRMSNLKKRCPSMYQKFMELRKIFNDRNYRKKVSNPMLISDLCNEEQNECFDYLDYKESF